MMPVLERQHPYHWLAIGQKELLLKRLEQQLRPILAAFHPRPVRYRTLDIRTSEFAQLIGAPAVEPNPMLGVRGAFSYPHQPQFFDLELTLLKRLQDQGYDNLQLVLPFVRTVEEIVYCRAAIATTGLQQHPDFALWIMAEVPSVLFQLPQYVAAGIQGIAIGTHDLTQLLLGIDRDQTIFAAPYDETHPAVQLAIAQLIDAAHQTGIPSCLCGSSPTHHPEFVAAAVRQRVTGLSVDVSALALTTQIVQRAETSG
jgi:pyruvate,water dikinase